MILRIFLIFFLSLAGYDSVTSISKHPIILIVSYDAFRYDYIDSKGVTPVLAKLRKLGTHAEYMNNAFITKTFPNHHSISTGLHPEVHGVLGNTVFDPKYDRVLFNDYEFWHYSEEIVPIWIANEKKGDGRHSGVMMWPGSFFNYTGVYPTHKKKFEWAYDWEKRVDEVIEWILHPEKPANLVLLYFEEPDSTGHQYGPDSYQHDEILKKMDNITNYLMTRLNENGLTDHVNIFFLSDHGMETIHRNNTIDLTQFVSSDKYDRYETPPTFMIYPKKGEANLVYNALRNASESGYPFKVYKREEILDRWYYKNNRRAPPILAVADSPFVFHDGKVQSVEESWHAAEKETFGVHGYDNTDNKMKPYFIAVGPLIKKNYKIKPFENIDLFSLWANMLGFPEYAARTNGSFERVADMLVSKYNQPPDLGKIGGALIGILLVGISVGMSIFFVRNKMRYQEKFFIQRSAEESLESRQRLLDCIETEEEA